MVTICLLPSGVCGKGMNDLGKAGERDVQHNRKGPPEIQAGPGPKQDIPGGQAAGQFRRHRLRRPESVFDSG